MACPWGGTPQPACEGMSFYKNFYWRCYYIFTKRKKKQKEKFIFDSKWSEEKISNLSDRDFYRLKNRLYFNSYFRVVIGIIIAVCCIIAIGLASQASASMNYGF